MTLKGSYSLAELKEMLPYILVFNAVLTAACVVIGIFYGFDWRLYTGIVTGNIIMVSNFMLIGYTVGRIVKCRDFRRGKLIGNLSYGLRYTGMFAVLAGLLTFGLISPVTAVIPLFYPKIYYTFFYVRSHREDD